ncbi:hypothetical protein ColLi_13289 [Colletotrichum liriopes]|uniref:GED domain-containing protein n=1 Tax=Colletotrichum liriopes TaxID=708192 RepID=A0AA37GZX8_9PEZI|nr:hypothetical protein ColLi_13289 [Colletotrichum liriopes]
MKRFIDDIAVEAIELVLVSALAEILSPVKVYKMKPDLVALVAGESEENRTYREQLTKQLEILSRGAEICKHFAVVKLSDTEEDAHDASSDGMGDQEDIHHTEDTASQASEIIAYNNNPEEASPAEPSGDAAPEEVDFDHERDDLTVSKKKGKKNKKNGFY